MTHRFVWTDANSGLIHGGAVAVAGWSGWGAEVLLVWTLGAPRAAGAKRTVALRAAAVHRLHQEPVDLLAQLDDVRCGDLALAALWREDIFVQRAPGNGGLINTVLCMYSGLDRAKDEQMLYF